MYMKLFMCSILLMDSMMGYIMEMNNMTYLLCMLNMMMMMLLLMMSENKSIYMFQLGMMIQMAFSTYNLLMWFMNFELCMIPMMQLMMMGSGKMMSKNSAMYKFMLYTMMSGFMLLMMMIYVLMNMGSLNYYNLLLKMDNWLFMMFMMPYLMKLPIMPFHMWLPDTHGEASTMGSMYLASMLLKLGGLGMMSWLMPIFPYNYMYMKPMMMMLSMMSGIYSSLMSLRHIDLKKLIAYSSIAHMSLILISFTNLNNLSILGCLFLLFSHGLISALLFYLIGILYIRTLTSYIYYFKGLVYFMPLYSSFLFMILLLNSSLPPSLSFFAELFILLSQFNLDIIGIMHILFVLLLSGFYNILLFCKISFTKITHLFKFNDLTLTEFYFILPLFLLSFTFIMNI